MADQSLEVGLSYNFQVCFVLVPICASNFIKFGKSKVMVRLGRRFNDNVLITGITVEAKFEKETL